MGIITTGNLGPGAKDWKRRKDSSCTNDSKSGLPLVPGPTAKIRADGICVGSYWDNRVHPYSLEPFKIMGIIDKWVVMKRPGAKPVVEHINRFGVGKEFVSVE